LTQEEQNVLDRICEAYYLPAWCSLSDYEQLFKEEGMQAKTSARISNLSVTPGWVVELTKAVIMPPQRL